MTSAEDLAAEHEFVTGLEAASGISVNEVAASPQGIVRLACGCVWSDLPVERRLRGNLLTTRSHRPTLKPCPGPCLPVGFLRGLAYRQRVINNAPPSTTVATGADA